MQHVYGTNLGTTSFFISIIIFYAAACRREHEGVKTDQVERLVGRVFIPPSLPPPTMLGSLYPLCDSMPEVEAPSL